MGRQHTTWISDETWERLPNIPGKSVSKKIANAVKYCDPDNIMQHKEDLRRLGRAKNALRAVANIVTNAKGTIHPEILDALENVEHLIWSADMVMKDE